MRWKRNILAVVALAFLAAFPWGPLFAWSPVHPGYREAHFSRADVLYPNFTALDPAYSQVDQYLAAAESFHALKCPRRIKVVVCRNWNDCLRFAAPFLMGQRPLAVTIATGTVTFVTPQGTGWVDIGGLLRHEFSHAVQSQNHSPLSVLRMLRHPWVSEGVAAVVAAQGVTAPDRHLITLPDPEFLSRADTEDLWASFAGAGWTDYRFSYTAWMYFWNRQIDRAGKPAFLRFERACFSDPAACREHFANIYGTPLRSAVEQFQTDVRSGHLVPPDRLKF